MPEKKLHWSQTPEGKKRMSKILAKARKMRGRTKAPSMNTQRVLVDQESYRLGYRDGFKDGKES